MLNMTRDDRHGCSQADTGLVDIDLRVIRSGVYDGRVDLAPVYAKLRDEAPVWRSPWGDVYVSTHELVSRCLADKSLLHVPPCGADAPLSTGENLLRQWLIYSEGPKHASIRKAMQAPFLGHGPARLRAAVDNAVDRAVQRLPTDETFDAIATLTRPLPVDIIGEVIGVPGSDRHMIAAWSAILRELLDSGFHEAFDGDDGLSSMLGYFSTLTERLLDQQEPPILAAGLPAVVAEFGVEVAASNLAFLAFAGQETTVHLLGSVLMHVSKRPDIWEMLRKDRALVPPLISEVLRLESPVQKICRWPAVDVRIGGVDVGAGELVVLLVGAANRDPSRFAQPNRLDPLRANTGALAFGRGPHVCIGRVLAEMEADSLLQTMLDRYATIKDAGAPVWMANASLRALDTLPIRLAAI